VPTRAETLDAVEGLAEWGLDLLVFFQKNVHHFVAMKASELGQELLTPAMVQADKKACPASPAAATTAISPPHAYNLPQSLLSLPPSSPLCQRLPMVRRLCSVCGICVGVCGVCVGACGACGVA
jgi:hypothetical protein